MNLCLIYGKLPRYRFSFQVQENRTQIFNATRHFHSRLETTSFICFEIFWHLLSSSCLSLGKYTWAMSQLIFSLLSVQKATTLFVWFEFIKCGKHMLSCHALSHILDSDAGNLANYQHTHKSEYLSNKNGQFILKIQMATCCCKLHLAFVLVSLLSQISAKLI